MSGPRACMGGWCGIREGCDHYRATDRRKPVERICGIDDGDGIPVRVIRPAGTWERRAPLTALRPAGPFDGLEAA